MSYYREAAKEELVKWLLDEGLAEDKAGYGHASADELADKLLARFDILTTSNSPKYNG